MVVALRVPFYFAKRVWVLLWIEGFGIVFSADGSELGFDGCLFYVDFDCYSNL